MHARRARGALVRARAPAPLARSCTVMADISTGFFIFFVQSTVDLVNCSTIVLGRGDGRNVFRHTRVCMTEYDLMRSEECIVWDSLLCHKSKSSYTTFICLK